MLRYLTAGESHGPVLTAIVEGLPAGLKVTPEFLNVQTQRRMGGYGRGARMKTIETDEVNITSGVRWGETLGSPVTVSVENKDWKNTSKLLSIHEADRDLSTRVVKPRPGHADLVGALKYGRDDVRDILERASARETAVRVAACTLGRRLLEEFGIQVFSYVRQMGKTIATKIPEDFSELIEKAEASPVRCPDPEATKGMMDEVDACLKAGDTLGGIYTVVVTGCPPGLGSHVQWDRKLDARIAGAILSMQAQKGVEFGMGFGMASRPGSQVHDEFFYEKKKGYYRGTNNAGGLEGGMTTGAPIVVSAVMKPISTLRKPLRSINMDTKEEFKAEVIRSDPSAVPAAGVIAEAVIAFEVANALMEKFGGDSLAETRRSYNAYLEDLKKR